MKFRETPRAIKYISSAAESCQFTALRLRRLAIAPVTPADSPRRHEVLRRLEWMTAAGDAQLWVADGSGVLWRQPTPENNAGNRVADRSGVTTPPFPAQRMSSPGTHATSSLGVGPGHDAPHSAGGSGQRVRAWRQPRPCRRRCRRGALTRRSPLRCRRRPSPHVSVGACIMGVCWRLTRSFHVWT